MRQLHELFKVSFRTSETLCHLSAMHVRAIGVAAMGTGDLAVVDLTVRYLNTFLGVSMAASRRGGAAAAAAAGALGVDSSRVAASVVLGGSAFEVPGPASSTAPSAAPPHRHAVNVVAELAALLRAFLACSIRAPRGSQCTFCTPTAHKGSPQPAASTAAAAGAGAGAGAGAAAAVSAAAGSAARGGSGPKGLLSPSSAMAVVLPLASASTLPSSASSSSLASSTPSSGTKPNLGSRGARDPAVGLGGPGDAADRCDDCRVYRGLVARVLRGAEALAVAAAGARAAGLAELAVVLADEIAGVVKTAFEADHPAHEGLLRILFGAIRGLCEIGDVGDGHGYGTATHDDLDFEDDLDDEAAGAFQSSRSDLRAAKPSDDSSIGSVGGVAIGASHSKSKLSDHTKAHVGVSLTLPDQPGGVGGDRVMVSNSTSSIVRSPSEHAAFLASTSMTSLPHNPDAGRARALSKITRLGDAPPAVYGVIDDDLRSEYNGSQASDFGGEYGLGTDTGADGSRRPAPASRKDYSGDSNRSHTGPRSAVRTSGSDVSSAGSLYGDGDGDAGAGAGAGAGDGAGGDGDGTDGKRTGERAGGNNATGSGNAGGGVDGRARIDREGSSRPNVTTGAGPKVSARDAAISAALANEARRQHLVLLRGTACVRAKLAVTYLVHNSDVYARTLHGSMVDLPEHVLAHAYREIASARRGFWEVDDRGVNIHHVSDREREYLPAFFSLFNPTFPKRFARMMRDDGGSSGSEGDSDNDDDGGAHNSAGPPSALATTAAAASWLDDTGNELHVGSIAQVRTGASVFEGSDGLVMRELWRPGM
jgi:hypothetical protein